MFHRQLINNQHQVTKLQEIIADREMNNKWAETRTPSNIYTSLSSSQSQ